MTIAAGSVGIVAIDSQMRWAWVSDEAAELNGIPAHEHIRQRVRDLLPDMGEELEASLTQAMHGETIRGTIRGPNIAGESADWCYEHLPGHETLHIGAIAVFWRGGGDPYESPLVNETIRYARAYLYARWLKG